jgi:hypothetical protein
MALERHGSDLLMCAVGDLACHGEDTSRVESPIGASPVSLALFFSVLFVFHIVLMWFISLLYVFHFCHLFTTASPLKRMYNMLRGTH